MTLMALLSGLAYFWMVSRPKGFAIREKEDGHFEIQWGGASQRERDQNFFAAVEEVDQGNYAKARPMLSAVIKDDPERHLALYMLAYTQRRLSMTAEATSNYEAYLASAGGSKYRYPAAIELSYLYLKQHQAGKARKNLGFLLQDSSGVKDPGLRKKMGRAWKEVSNAKK